MKKKKESEIKVMMKMRNHNFRFDPKRIEDKEVVKEVGVTIIIQTTVDLLEETEETLTKVEIEIIDQKKNKKKIKMVKNQKEIIICQKMHINRDNNIKRKITIKKVSIDQNNKENMMMIRNHMIKILNLNSRNINTIIGKEGTKITKTKGAINQNKNINKKEK